jgi:putative OPT family oligopeptide transporter
VDQIIQIGQAGQAGKAAKAGRASSQGAVPRTDRDLPARLVAIGSATILLAIGLTPIIPAGLAGALITGGFGFVFALVAARMAGKVGSSNSPVSGMAIAALAFTAFVFKLTGNDGLTGMTATVAVGGIICMASAVACDTSQDLKTGWILGATPRAQQLGELLGAAASSLVIGLVFLLLHKAWGFGSEELPAPQALLMKVIVEGVMDQTFPAALMLSGMALGLLAILFRLPAMAMAVGLYLPVNLSSALLIGGLARKILSRPREGVAPSDLEAAQTRGVLFSSGLVAGEGIMGLALAAMAVLGTSLGPEEGSVLGPAFGVIAFGLVCWTLVKVAGPGRRGKQ